MNEKPDRETAAKLLTMSRRGTTHEREIAAQKLAAYLERHGLTMDDIDPENTDWYAFSFANRLEEKLLFQVHFLVTNTWNNIPYRIESEDGGVISLELTKAQAVEMDRFYEFYRRLLEREIDIFFGAFVQRNRIFGQKPKKDESEFSPEERVKRLRMAEMSQLVKRGRPYKELGEGSQ